MSVEPAVAGPERVFRETFLWRFDEEGAKLFEQLGGLLLNVAETRGFRLDRGQGPVSARLLAVAADLEHLARYLGSLSAEPVEALSARDLALCRQAGEWAPYLEVAVHALRREAGGERGGPVGS